MILVPKTQNWYSMPPCLTLSIIRYGSRVSGAIQGKEWHPPLHVGAVAIEKEAFGSASTTVCRLIYIYLSLILISVLRDGHNTISYRTVDWSLVTEKLLTLKLFLESFVITVCEEDFHQSWCSTKISTWFPCCCFLLI